MPKVTFLPDQKTVEAQSGSSILDVALDHDIDLQHACGGFCACTTCHVQVLEGLDSLTEIDPDEAERLENTSDYSTHSRLGCQAKLGTSDITVRRVNAE